MICTLEPDLKDAELVSVYHEQSDADAFAQLESRYKNRLFMFIRNLRSEGVEDLVQETWRDVAKNIERFQPEGNFVLWLFGIARNKVYEANRRAKRRCRAGVVKSFEDAHEAGEITYNPDTSSPETAECDTLSRSTKDPWDLDRKAVLPQDVMDKAEQIELVRAAMENISPAARDMLERFYYDPDPIDSDALAEELGVSVQTVRSRRRAALDELTRMLALVRAGKCPLPEEVW